MSGPSIVYVLVVIGLVLPKESFAKYLSVVVVDMVGSVSGLVPLGLDVVGVAPLVV